MSVSTINSDVLSASLGRSVALAYGRHWVGGNVILKDETDPNITILFVALGEGEWDAVEKLFVNGLEIDVLTIGTEHHFHRGLLGELSSSGDLYPEGIGAAYPFTTDGDQKADGFTPAAVQGLTFSHTAYLALAVPFDPGAPSAQISVLGQYRCRRVRIFDAGGVQTGYQWNDNPRGTSRIC